MSLKDKVVYVAGGSGIIGSCTVLACLQNGAKVWTSMRSESKFEEYRNSMPEEFRSNLVLRKADLTTEEDCIKIAEEIMRVDGKINHVLSAIGGWREDGNLSEVSLDLFKNSMEEMGISHFIVYRTFARLLNQTPGSTYIFVTGGSVDDSVLTMVPACASMLPPSTSLVHGLHVSACSEFKDSNLAPLQLRIYFMISRAPDSTHDLKTSRGAGSDYIGKFIVKMIQNHRNNLLYKLESRAAAEEYLKSM